MKLDLYKFDTCPYCRRVMNAIRQSGRNDITLHDIHQNQDDLDYLIEHGGKSQVPCLFIDGQALYESADIIAWLEEHPEKKLDCGFTKENHWFRCRTGGIIIHNQKMLFVKSSIGGYYYMIGGGVHLGETSVACMEREVMEETGIQTKVERLAVICENFFRGKGGMIDGKDCHTIELYFYMQLTDEQFQACKEKTDDGEDLVWVDIDEIANCFVKPNCIAERISEILNSKDIIHMIEERDR